MARPTPEIDSARLRATLDAVNGFGRNPATGGFNRVGYSDSDMAVRRWLADAMAADGLAVRTDAVANVFGRYGPAEGPCVLAGSHLDTVAEGGAFDGALGVCVALECARAMREAGFLPTTALEVVATAEEEGRFGGMLGAQAIVGAVTREWIDAAVDADGVRLADAMRAQGLDPEGALTAAWPLGGAKAFVELHIEQGPALESAGVAVGVAEAVSGVRYLAVRLAGRANHSGTTPMDLRADAFAGLAQVGCAVPEIIATLGTEQSRITIGHVEIRPNHPHTIPGEAEFSVIIRDADADVIERLTQEVETAVSAAATANGLGAAVETRSRLDPVTLDADLAALASAEAERLGLPCLRMISGAGHDAQTMQRLCPSALIFVPSRGGVSHAPQEWTDWADIEKGARLMLATLMRLCG